MNLNEKIFCPKCTSVDFTAKYESTYVYSYNINSPRETGNKHEGVSLPFLFDKREQKNARQFIECNNCATRFPCTFSLNSEPLNFTIVKKAIHDNYTETPELL